MMELAVNCRNCGTPWDTHISNCCPKCKTPLPQEVLGQIKKVEDKNVRSILQRGVK